MSDKADNPPKGDEFYKSVGFACGLEIHQRLATEKKLFCSCAANMSKEKLVGSVTRQQRAVSGELGGVDVASEFEGQKNREFEYHIFDSSTCLVDIDEEPPHEINREALRLSLAIGKAFKMRFFDELQPMRKGVVDGSDPSAFQRTVLVGVDGSLPINGRNIGISLMSLEEESSRIQSSSGSHAVYSTEGLGVPLIEIDTDPTIASASEAKAVALKIGTILRLTGLVQRGIGSIRQDLNVSIKGGERVEIKGMQELDLMDKFVDMEIMRQQKLLEIKEELLKNKASVGVPVNVTDLFKDSNALVISDQIFKSGWVFAFELHGFEGLLGREINPGRRLGTEISDYAKSAGVGGIIHSDEKLGKYNLTDQEINALKERLKIRDSERKSAFIIVAGPFTVAKKAAEAAAERAKQAIAGIPRETRAVANVENCTTKFMRPIAGGSRMYPETDLHPILLTERMLKDAEENAPDLDRERELLLRQLGSNDLAEKLIMSPRLVLYRYVVAGFDVDRVFVANILLQKFTELKRAGFDVDGIQRELLGEMFRQYAIGKITKQAVEEVIKALAKGARDVQKVILEGKLHRITGLELEELVKSETNAKPAEQKEALIRGMMSKYKINVDGNELKKIVENS